MKIKRRIFNKEDSTTKIIIESAELVKMNEKTVFVKLKNGNIIKRKKKDVVKWK